ncbi:MAG TPA: hypothetical protein VH682_31845 [Gemmataceae bacterium]
MNTCDKCGKSLCAADEHVYLVEMSVGPCPEAPHGYGCEVELCERCYLRYCEGLDQVDREDQR